MNVIETDFKGLFVIEPDVFQDPRGSFFESWNKKRFEAQGLTARFVQHNESFSCRNVLRGLHFQLPPWEQGKLVRVMRGAVLDVVVDLRKSEPTYGKFFALQLTEEKKNMLWIPAGFAHGFLTLEDSTIFSYKCTQFYHKQSEDSLLWNDPDLAIDWGVKNPLVSEKDAKAPLFKDFDSPF